MSRTLPAHAAEARGRSASAASPQAIGRAATLALYDELALAPKPGLVSFVDSGSHQDMDARTFMRSLFALRGYFVRIAALGAANAEFGALQACGVEAEQAMLAATGGVNTHRGAVFMLGLLCAAAGRLAAQRAEAAERAAFGPADLRRTLLACWGAALERRSRRAPTLPGGLAAQRHGLRGASAEAAAGFPMLFDVAVPALQEAAAAGLPREAARLQTLMQVMAVLDDCNVAHRGGIEGLHHVQAEARAFLAAGGSGRPESFAAARAMHRGFVARRLSPGGAADTLAAACWVQRVCTI